MKWDAGNILVWYLVALPLGHPVKWPYHQDIPIMHKDHVNNCDIEVRLVIVQLIISRPAPRLLSPAVTYTYDSVFGFDTIHFRTSQYQEHSLHHRASTWRTASKGRLFDRQKKNHCLTRLSQFT